MLAQSIVTFSTEGINELRDAGGTIGITLVGVLALLALIKIMGAMIHRSIDASNARDEQEHTNER